ncbi:MAG: DUF4233 domain-containing protein [Nocardioidaceae bacterium]|nr:DUF4233 domain-containing protein [Nocardioidaceae bacterium]
MRARLCAATLGFEAVVIALATPVMIAVEDVPVALALVVGLGLAVLAIVAAGMLRRPGGFVVGHAVQVGAVAMGFLVPAMFFVGAMFAALWIAAHLIGRRIETDRARWAAEAEGDVA